MSQFPGINQLLKTEEKLEEELDGSLDTEFLTEDAREINSAIANSLRDIGDVTEEALIAAVPGRFIRAINLEYLAELFRNGPVLTIRMYFSGAFSTFFVDDIRQRVSERTPIIEEGGSTVVTVFINERDSERTKNNLQDYVELLRRSKISSFKTIGMGFYQSSKNEGSLGRMGVHSDKLGHPMSELSVEELFESPDRTGTSMKTSSQITEEQDLLSYSLNI